MGDPSWVRFKPRAPKGGVEQALFGGLWVVAVSEGAAGRAIHEGLFALQGNVRVIALAKRAIPVA